MHRKLGSANAHQASALLCVFALAFSAALCPIAAADGLEAPPEEFYGAGGSLGSSDPFGDNSFVASSSDGTGGGGAPSFHLPRNAAVMDQSAYAMGSMTWNVIFLESNGAIDANVENWTPTEITKIQSEIGQAKTYWEGLTSGFHPGARLSIDIHYENGGIPMATSYEPITRSSASDGLWINDAMNTLGYFSSNRFTNVRNYNHARRVDDNNHWATTIFVVDDTVDADNRFSNSNFAYAYFNGPYAMLTQGNNGWGIDNFNMVMSHEMGHIFGALDEYQGSGVRNTQRAGYLNGLTLNASLNGSGSPVAPPQPNALMLNNGNSGTGVTHLPHSSALVNFGLRDIDGDTIPDILDTGSILTGNALGSDPNDGDFVFAGSITVNDFNNANPLNVGFSNSLADMTINTIMGLAFSLDGGAPSPFAALDGFYDDYTEALGFSILGLSYGLHTIDVVGVDSVGNSSNVLHFQFNSLSAPEPTSFLLAIIGLMGLLKVRRRRGC